MIQSSILKHYFKRTALLTCLGSLYLTSVISSVRADTLADALISAHTYNPIIQARRAEIGVASELATQARAGYYPNIETGIAVGLEYTDINVADDPQTLRPMSASISANQLLYDWGRTKYTVDSARSSVRSTKSNLNNAEQTALIEGVRTYMNVLRDLRLVELAENNVRVLFNQQDAAQARFDVGEVTLTDVSQATARLALAKSNLSIRRGQLAQSKQSYLRAIGRPAVNLQNAPPLPDLPESLEDAIAISLENDPNLRSAQFALDASEANIKVAETDILPRFSLNGNLASTSEQSQEDVSTNSAGISINMNAPIYQGGRNYSAIRQAEAEANVRRAELQDTARLIREATAIAWEQLAASQSTISVSKEQIKAAEVAFEGVTEETKVGFRTTLDLLDAEQELLEARTNLVSAKRDEQVAAYELLRAIGLLTIEHLGLEGFEEIGNIKPLGKENTSGFYNYDE